MSCCDTGSGFPDAGLAIELGKNHAVIWAEICAIQQAILQSFCGCSEDCIGCGGSSNCVTVAGNTPMTFVENIESVVVLTGGVDYVDPITVITDIRGGGAELETIVDLGVITQVNVINGGANYSQEAEAIAIRYDDQVTIPENPIEEPDPNDATFSVTARKNPWCTNPESYYKVINDICSNSSTLAQLEQVASYFRKLGYSVTIITNPETGNTIQWVVCW